VDFFVEAEVPENRAASTFKANAFSPEDGDSTLLRNIGHYEPFHTVI
jgi:hypothetical protein